MKKLFKAYFTLFSRIAPRIAAHQAFELFQIPINNKIRDKELGFYSENMSFQIHHELEPIDIYESGPADGHLIFLIHGWESNAASLSGISKKLVEKGFRTVSFNLPAHGYSKLKKSNIKVSKDFLLKVISHYDPKQPVSFVSHSFGSLVTSYALSKINLKVAQLVMLTAPNHSTDVFDYYKNMIGLNHSSFNHLIKKADDILGEPLSKVSIENFGKKIDYKKLTIIQDKKDRIVSANDAKVICKAWDKSELVLIENTGHYKMLWNDNVYKLVLDQFMKTEVISTKEV